MRNAEIQNLWQIAFFSPYILILALNAVVMGQTNHPNGKKKYVASYDIAPPHQFEIRKNGSTQVAGTDIDLLKLVCKRLQHTLTFQEMPWARTLQWTESGKVDIAIGAGFQEKRTEWAYYSVPYKFIRHDLFVRRNELSAVNSLESFLNQGKTIGVVIGWGYPVEIRELLLQEKYKTQVHRVGDFSQLLPMLDLKRLDGIIGIPETVSAQAKKTEFKHQFSSRCFYKEELHFMFSKKSVPPAFIADFNNELYKLLYRGERKTIFEKYMQSK